MKRSRSIRYTKKKIWGVTFPPKKPEKALLTYKNKPVFTYKA